MLLKNFKYPLINVHNKLGLVKPRQNVFDEKIYEQVYEVPVTDKLKRLDSIIEKIKLKRYERHIVNISLKQIIIIKIRTFH